MAIWERPVDVGQPGVSRALLVRQVIASAVLGAFFVVAVRAKWGYAVELGFFAGALQPVFYYGYVAFRRAQARGWI